jgi:hypothetical protein
MAMPVATGLALGPVGVLTAIAVGAVLFVLAITVSAVVLAVLHAVLPATDSGAEAVHRAEQQFEAAGDEEGQPT